MDILGRARKLESRIARTVDRAAQQWARSGRREPLEVLHAIVAAVDDRLEPAGRGRHVFPFNRIRVFVAAGSRDARARFAAILEGDPPLQDLVAARLLQAGCDPAGLHVKTTYVAGPETDWPQPEFHVEFERSNAVEIPSAVEGTVRELELTIAAGSGERPTYTFARCHVTIGRGAEVRDRGNRLIRTNAVVFVDGEDAIARTVSRQHAHIDYVAAAAEYRIVDDRSEHGTSIVRDGRTIPVPAGARGLRLRSGDAIALGEARIRVTISAG